MPSVKENLIKMKDTAELMLDLSYAAVVVSDTAIMTEVEKMYVKMQSLESDALKLLFRVRGSEEARLFMTLLISQVMDVASDAMHMAQLARLKAVPTMVQDVFRQADRRVLIEQVAEHAAFANRCIGDIDIQSRTHARIVAIKRKGAWVFNVNDKTELLPGDVLIALGPAHAEKLFKEGVSARQH